MASRLRRGFKSDAERIALALREELGLGPVDSLDCHDLASHLGVPVVSLPQLAKDGASQRSIRRLLSDAAGFSALTICVGTHRLIVYNPTHPAGRKANSLAHETSHIILEHPPSPPIGEGGCRKWDDRLEAEADWLAGVLLVPRDGALEWISRGGTIASGATHFGVSKALFQWRVNHTGVVRQIAARDKWR